MITFLVFFLIAALAGTIVFLLLELRKQYSLMHRFTRTSQQLRVHDHKDAKQGAMRQIIITWNRPFRVLIGFEYTFLGRIGANFYGHARSTRDGDKQHSIVIETWLGKRGCLFHFLFDQDMGGDQPVITEHPAGTKPVTKRYTPHWWQKHLGI